QQYDDIVKDIATKLGIPAFEGKPIGLHGELRTNWIKDWLSEHGGEVGLEIADIIEFPRAVRRLINSLPDPVQNEPKIAEGQSDSPDLAGAQRTSTEDVQPESEDQGSDREIQNTDNQKVTKNEIQQTKPTTETIQPSTETSEENISQAVN